MTLRPYQTAMVAKLEHPRRRRTLAVMPTGAGKTVTFAELIRRRGRSSLIVAHRRELIRQASAKLTAAGVPHGIICPGFPRASHPVQVCSIGSRNLPAADDIVLDEAHHAVAGQWQRLLEANPDATVFGWTATPERLDGRGLGDVFDGLEVGPSVPELIAVGCLVPSRVYAPPAMIDLRGVGERLGDYAQDALARAMDVPGVTGDAVEHYGWHCPTQPAIVFCASVLHAEHTAEAFRAKGWRAVAVSGRTRTDERDAGIFGLADGSVEVLCTCDLVGEGVDVPAVSAVILLTATQSLTKYMQWVGRGMRPDNGKTHLTVLDHGANVMRHGMPDAARHWTLDGVAKKARAPAIRQCPSCYAIHAPGPACPACGYRSTPDDVPGRKLLNPADGTLTEVTADDARLRTAPLRELVRGARGYDDLRKIADARGYADGWIGHNMPFVRRRGVERSTAAEDFGDAA